MYPLLFAKKYNKTLHLKTPRIQMHNQNLGEEHASVVSQTNLPTEEEFFQKESSVMKLWEFIKVISFGWFYAIAEKH